MSRSNAANGLRLPRLPRTGAFFGALAIGVILGAPSLHAVEKLNASGRTLFRIGWTTRISDRTVVDAYVDQAPPAVKTAGFQYAHGLILIKQRRYDLAAAQLQSVIRIDRSHLAAWRALTWVRVLTQKYPQALSELDQLSQIVATNLYDNQGQERKMPAADLQANLDTVKALAQLLAFLDFPAAKIAPAPLRNTFRNRITARFKGRSLTVFREAQQEVIDLHHQLQRRIATQGQLAVQKGERRRQEDLRDLQDIQKRIRNRKDDLIEQQDRVTKDVNKRRTQISEQARPLQRRLSTLDSLSGQNFFDRNRAALDLSRLYRQLRRSRDPVMRSWIRRDIDLLENTLANHDFQRWRINREANSVISQRDQLDAERQNLERNYVERARRDAKEFSKLNRRERRTEAQTRKLRDKKPSASRMVRGLVAKSRALATFVPFPLELEKLRLLGN